MQLTRAADYAVRVMVHLAGLPIGTRTTRDELAAHGDVPEHFLSKILQSLARSGLIAAHRGMMGGYELARPAESVTLLDVVEAMEGPLVLKRPCDRGADVPAQRLVFGAPRLGGGAECADCRVARGNSQAVG